VNIGPFAKIGWRLSDIDDATTCSVIPEWRSHIRDPWTQVAQVRTQRRRRAPPTAIGVYGSRSSRPAKPGWHGVEARFPA